MGSNGKRAIRNTKTCSWTLVYREKGSDNCTLHTSTGSFWFVHFTLVESTYFSLLLWLIYIPYFLQAIVLDQGLEADSVLDIQKYLEDLIGTGLRQQLISLIKV